MHGSRYKVFSLALVGFGLKSNVKVLVCLGAIFLVPTSERNERFYRIFFKKSPQIKNLVLIVF